MGSKGRATLAGNVVLQSYSAAASMSEMLSVFV